MFDKESLLKLKQCHPELQSLFSEVIKHRNCIITCGYRDKDDQEKAFAEGKTKLHYPNGNHNKLPSNAVDAYPAPINMNNLSLFYNFAGFVQGIAQQMLVNKQMNHAIRWGGNWDNNGKLNMPGQLNDLVHFELILE